MIVRASDEVAKKKICSKGILSLYKGVKLFKESLLQNRAVTSSMESKKNTVVKLKS